MKSKNQRLTEILFLIYLLALVWIIVFKMEFSLSDINGMQNINLDPYSAPARIDGVIVYEEIYFNILAFVPLGLYLGILFKKWNVYQNIIVFLLLSLSFEVIQYIFSIGASDITDVINNVLGGILGMLFYKILNFFIKDKHYAHKLINIFAAIGTVLVIIVLFILKIT